MALSELIAVVPPPDGSGQAEVDWEAVEQRLGLPLPQDYKDFIGRYGQGSFDDFLHPYQPVTDNEYLDLAHRQVIDLDALRTLQRDFPEGIPYRVTDPAELLPVALTDNGEIVYWHVTDPKAPIRGPSLSTNPAARNGSAMKARLPPSSRMS
jgi:hypothetical protein